jgi:hypothetical protein
MLRPGKLATCPPFCLADSNCRISLFTHFLSFLFQAMETIILDALLFDVISVTPGDFLDAFLTFLDVPMQFHDRVKADALRRINIALIGKPEFGNFGSCSIWPGLLEFIYFYSEIYYKNLRFCFLTNHF